MWSLETLRVRKLSLVPAVSPETQPGLGVVCRESRGQGDDLCSTVGSQGVANNTPSPEGSHGHTAAQGSAPRPTWGAGQSVMENTHSPTGSVGSSCRCRNPRMFETAQVTWEEVRSHPCTLHRPPTPAGATGALLSCTITSADPACVSGTHLSAGHPAAGTV